jgi:hypothetical protein
MYFDFSTFCTEKIQRISSIDSELNLLSQKNEKEDYETIACLSKQETLYMKQFDSSYCFLLTFPGENIENKNLLMTNLNILREFIQKSIALK